MHVYIGVVVDVDLIAPRRIRFRRCRRCRAVMRRANEMHIRFARARQPGRSADCGAVVGLFNYFQCTVSMVFLLRCASCFRVPDDQKGARTAKIANRAVVQHTKRLFVIY